MTTPQTGSPSGDGIDGQRIDANSLRPPAHHADDDRDPAPGLSFPITLIPIGHVRRDHPADPGAFTDPTAPADLVILPDFAAGLDGIEQYSHLIVLCWFDRTTRPAILDAPIHPEARAGIPPVGLFATRSPRRPNPIAIATPRLISRDGPILTVSGLDAWDATPILDIKGYLPTEDAHPDAAIPAWLAALHALHAAERP